MLQRIHRAAPGARDPRPAPRQLLCGPAPATPGGLVGAPAGHPAGRAEMEGRCALRRGAHARRGRRAALLAAGSLAALAPGPQSLLVRVPGWGVDGAPHAPPRSAEGRPLLELRSM